MNRPIAFLFLLALLGAWTHFAQAPRRAASRSPASAPPRVATPGAVPLWGGRLDLNAASAADLEALPGIGPVRAARIVDIRARRGGRFERVDDLLDVPGIGRKTVARLRDQVTVGP